ncbi:MAG: hypothetical protein IRZ03_18080 [Acidobacterium ailaaui]|nr:hypothetical protein [Pseudacidobacterium ailaaui]
MFQYREAWQLVAGLGEGYTMVVSQVQTQLVPFSMQKQEPEKDLWKDLLQESIIELLFYLSAPLLCHDTSPLVVDLSAGKGDLVLTLLASCDERVRILAYGASSPLVHSAQADDRLICRQTSPLTDSWLQSASVICCLNPIDAVEYWHQLPLVLEGLRHGGRIFLASWKSRGYPPSVTELLVGQDGGEKSLSELRDPLLEQNEGIAGQELALLQQAGFCHFGQVWQWGPFRIWTAQRPRALSRSLQWQEEHHARDTAGSRGF